jgi:Leucine-rich repeat (LRR) protein
MGNSKEFQNTSRGSSATILYLNCSIATDLPCTLCRTDWTTELPEEMLWKIMGCLDLRTLCTARLVCKLFRQSASGHLKALHLDSKDLEQSPSSSLTRLSGLRHLGVSINGSSQLPSFARLRIAPHISHVTVQWACFQDMQGGTDSLAPLALLPNLRSLVMGLPVGVCEIESLPVRLKALHFAEPIRKDASCLTRFSGLRKLRVELAAGAGQSLGSLTSLRSLRALELTCGVSALRALSTFTMLTSVTWDVGFDDASPGDMFREMGQLTGLSRLEVRDILGKVARDHLACLLPLTKLTCLGLDECELADDVAASTALVPLTRLVSLRLLCQAYGMSLVRTLNLEAFQSLELSLVKGDTSVLHRATGLTHLDLDCWGSESLQGLGSTLRRMPELCSLSIDTGSKLQAQSAFNLSPVLQALTNLTKLRYSGNFTVDIDLRACAALPGLRNLRLTGISEVTPSCLPALQAMSGLSELTLCHTGIRSADLTPEVRAAFGVERHVRGWPRVELVCYDASRRIIAPSDPLHYVYGIMSAGERCGTKGKVGLISCCRASVQLLG